MFQHRDNDDEKESDDKPRRLDEETVIYLMQIEPQLQNTKLPDHEVLIANVLAEVSRKTASAIADRRTNIAMEALVLGCSVEQVLSVLSRCQQYMTFLSCNRHASHVIQAAFSRLAYLLKVFTKFFKTICYINFSSLPYYGISRMRVISTKVFLKKSTKPLHLSRSLS